MSRNPVFAGALAVVLIGMLGIIVEAHEVGASGETYAIPDEYHISGVPFVKQETMWCGPASLTMVLNYWGDPVSQNKVGSTVDPEHDGTHPSSMISFLRSRRYGVYDFDNSSIQFRISVMDELKTWVYHDYPIIVRQTVHITNRIGHYRVVVGYDAENIYVIDPSCGSLAFSIEYFLQLWDLSDEYGLIVMGDTTKDSDGDHLTDSNEVIRNTDPFEPDPFEQKPFPLWMVALIVIAVIVEIALLVYFKKVRKASENAK